MRARPPDGELLAAAFDLGPVRSPPTYVVRGELGEVWKLVTSAGEWAVKQLRVAVDETSGGDLPFQMALLAAGGVPMPGPMVSATGSPILVEPATGTGYRVYEWVDHVPGATVGPLVAGGLLARIHTLDHPAESIDPWFYVPVEEDELRSFRRRAQAHAEDMAWAPLLERRFGDLLDTLALVPGTPPARLVRCHLDFGSDNVLVDRAGGPWVIDWENSGGGDPDQELTQVATFFGDAVLAGYWAAGGPAELRGLDSFAMTSSCRPTSSPTACATSWTTVPTDPADPTRSATPAPSNASSAPSSRSLTPAASSPPRTCDRPRYRCKPSRAAQIHSPVPCASSSIGRATDS